MPWEPAEIVAALAGTGLSLIGAHVLDARRARAAHYAGLRERHSREEKALRLLASEAAWTVKCCVKAVRAAEKSDGALQVDFPAGSLWPDLKEDILGGSLDASWIRRIAAFFATVRELQELSDAAQRHEQDGAGAWPGGNAEHLHRQAASRSRDLMHQRIHALVGFGNEIVTAFGTGEERHEVKSDVIYINGPTRGQSPREPRPERDLRAEASSRNAHESTPG